MTSTEKRIMYANGHPSGPAWTSGARAVLVARIPRQRLEQQWDARPVLSAFVRQASWLQQPEHRPLAAVGL